MVQDDYGEEEITWTDWATVWAAVEPLRGREFMEAKQVQAEVTHRMRMRYRDGISPEKRVSFDGRTFDILAVIHVAEREREVQLMCREIVEY